MFPKGQFTKQAYNFAGKRVSLSFELASSPSPAYSWIRAGGQFEQSDGPFDSLHVDGICLRILANRVFMGRLQIDHYKVETLGIETIY